MLLEATVNLSPNNFEHYKYVVVTVASNICELVQWNLRPKASGECRSWGWKGANCLVASSTSTIPVTFWCLQAALTIAAAIPALIALGYSFAYEIFNEPSAFLPIRQSVGALGLSNFLNSSVSSLPILTDMRLVGFLVSPPNLQCWR